MLSNLQSVHLLYTLKDNTILISSSPNLDRKRTYYMKFICVHSNSSTEKYTCILILKWKIQNIPHQKMSTRNKIGNKKNLLACNNIYLLMARQYKLYFR